MKNNLKQACLVIALAAVLAVDIAPAHAPEASAQVGANSQAWPSVVRVVALAQVTVGGQNRLFVVSSGSGTVVSQDGYILTSLHLVDAKKLQDMNQGRSNVRIIENVAAIEISEDPNKAPIPSYIAEPVPGSAIPQLDLVLLKITRDLNNQPVTGQSLGLPPLEMLDSDGVRTGDPVSVLGYQPGTLPITSISAQIAGASHQTGIQGNAWLNLNVSVPAGVSGGAAVDRNGRLVGVPGIVAASSCRAFVDTNGDGRVDNSDLCMLIDQPTNQLRPINLIYPTIQQYITTNPNPRPNPNPFPEPNPNPNPVPNPNPIPNPNPNPRPNPNPPSDEVTLKGRVVDATTGRPTAATVWVFREGIGYNDIASYGVQAILDYTGTQPSGNFQIRTPLKRGGRYTIMVTNSGLYQPVVMELFQIPQDSPNELFMEFKIEIANARIP